MTGLYMKAIPEQIKAAVESLHREFFGENETGSVNWTKNHSRKYPRKARRTCRSNPLIPAHCLLKLQQDAMIPFAYEPEGRVFESPRAHHEN